MTPFSAKCFFFPRVTLDRGRSSGTLFFTLRAPTFTHDPLHATRKKKKKNKEEKDTPRTLHQPHFLIIILPHLHRPTQKQMNK